MFTTTMGLAAVGGMPMLVSEKLESFSLNILPFAKKNPKTAAMLGF
jgi:hypothetical protein